MSRFAQLTCFLSFLFVASCGWYDSTDPEDRRLCAAMTPPDTIDFLNAGGVGMFDQRKNTGWKFEFKPTGSTYDGQNVIELKSSQVAFDYEDEAVDTGNFGGFFSSFYILLVPYEASLLATIQIASQSYDPQAQQDAINLLKTFSTRTDIQLNGPFLESGCEWGDTDLIGVQQLAYANYGVYDWDFNSGVTRVIGVIAEADEEPARDDLIAILDIDRSMGTVTVEDARSYPGKARNQFIFEAETNVTFP
jgi:hypothetical protein